MRLRSLVALLPLGVVAVNACSSSTPSTPTVPCGPDALATTNVDVVAVTNYEAGWYLAAVDPIPLGLYALSTGTAAAPPAQDVSVALAVAAAVGTYYPSGCAAARAFQNVVTFTLDNCVGPLGLANSTGTITATYATTANGQIQVQLAGNDVRTNGASVNLAATGVATVAPSGQKTLHVTTQSGGTGVYGSSADHMGTYTLVWPTGTNCGTIDGMLTGIGAGANAGTTTQITSYLTCTGACPQSGAATNTFAGGTLTLIYLGINFARCSASDTTTGSIQLQCP